MRQRTADPGHLCISAQAVGACASALAIPEEASGEWRAAVGTALAVRANWRGFCLASCEYSWLSGLSTELRCVRSCTGSCTLTSHVLIVRVAEPGCTGACQVEAALIPRCDASRATQPAPICTHGRQCIIQGVVSQGKHKSAGGLRAWAEPFGVTSPFPMPCCGCPELSCISYT